LIASGGEREDVPESARPEAFGRACAVEASLAKIDGASKARVWLFSRDGPGGRPITGQAVPGVKAA
jgi:hypothetical protein